MGIHFCGWCGKMSDGGFHDEGQGDCRDEFTKLNSELDKDLKDLCGGRYKEIREKINKVSHAMANCE